MDDSSNIQPGAFGPTFPTYPVLPQVLRVTAGPVPGTSPQVFPAVAEQWTGAGFRDREACYITEINNLPLAATLYLGRLVGAYNGLPLYAVAQTVGEITDFTNLTLILNNTTINVLGVSVFNLFANLFFSFQTNNTFIEITGNTTNLFVLDVPLKLDSLFYLRWDTKIVQGGDIGPGTNTWDDWAPTSDATVWRIIYGGGFAQAQFALTGIAPAAQPVGAPAGNGEVLWLLNCGSIPLVIKHQSGNSPAAHQIFCPGGFDLTLDIGGGIAIGYDPISLYWRVLTMEAGGFTGTDSSDVCDLSFDSSTCTLTYKKRSKNYTNGRVQNFGQCQ